MPDWFWAYVTVPNVGVASAILSALCWFGASFTNARLGVTYLNRLPPDLVRFQRRQALLNSAAALLSAVSAICAAWVLKYPPPPS